MIEVTNIRPINKGNILASVSVAIHPWKLTIHRIMVMQQGLNRWINMPGNKFETSTGETKWEEHLEFMDSSVKARFRDQIMKVIDEYIERNGDLIPEDIIKENEPLPF